MLNIALTLTNGPMLSDGERTPNEPETIVIQGTLHSRAQEMIAIAKVLERWTAEANTLYEAKMASHSLTFHLSESAKSLRKAIGFTL